MHPVVPGQAELLELAVVVEPKAVADQLADRLALVVLQHGEAAARDRRAQQQQRGGQQRIPGGIARHIAGGGPGQQAAGLVDGAAEILRHQ